MNEKEFNKENVLALIDEKQWQAEFWMNQAKTKKEANRHKAYIDICQILRSNINAIWPETNH